MASVTQKITSYLGGVSKQPDDRKFPGQVSDIINGLPDVTFGLTKRPGFEFISTLKTGSVGYYDSSKWFYIGRDDDEQYIGCIRYGSPSTIEIWNTDGTSCTVNYTGTAQDYLDALDPIEDYDVLTVQDTTIITNKTTTVAAQAAPAAATTKYYTLRINGSETSSEYFMRLNDGTTSYYFEAQDRTDPAYAAPETATSPYITRNSDTIGSTPVETLSAKQILDDVEVAFARWVASGLTNFSYFRTDDTVVMNVPLSYNFIARGGAGGDLFTYYQDEVENVTDLPIQELSGRKVKVTNTSDPEASYWAIFEIEDGDRAGEVTLTAGGTGYTGAIGVATTTTGNGSGLTVDTTDTAGVITSFRVNDPGQGYLVGDTVTISGGGGDATFTVDTVYGKGIWVETIDPTVSPGLDASTMPHQLKNTALNTFELLEIPWVDRLTGDDITNIPPSFVGNKINGSFFYSNRLGFLTQSNVSMSQAGDFYNFYFKTATAIADNDPIDLNTSSIRPTLLYAAVGVPSGLLLFSENEQFLMFSADAALTPQSSVIRSLSNYEMERTIHPVNDGVDVIFASRAPGYLKVFNFSPRGEQDPPVVTEISRIVADYLPNTMETLQSNAQNKLIWLTGPTDRYVYLQRTYGESEDGPLQAWFRWQAPGYVHGMFIDEDEVWAVVEDGNSDYVLLRADFNRTPATTVIQSSTGQQVNPAVDFYDVASSVSYSATTLDTKCYLPFNHDNNIDTTIITPGTGYSNDTAVVTSTDGEGEDMTVDITTSGGEVTAVTINSRGTGYRAGDTVTILGDYSNDCTFTINFILRPVIIIKGAGFIGGGTVDSGSFQEATYGVDGTGDYFLWQKGDLSGQASDVLVGYLYDYMVDIPKTYFQNEQGADYTAYLKIARMKFSLSQTGIVEFKLTTRGRLPWTFTEPTIYADYYLGDDVPIEEERIVTVPINQRNTNFDLSLSSDSPFPVSLTAMMWEGLYSPRFYQRS